MIALVAIAIGFWIRTNEGYGRVERVGCSVGFGVLQLFDGQLSGKHGPVQK